MKHQQSTTKKQNPVKSFVKSFSYRAIGARNPLLDSFFSYFGAAKSRRIFIYEDHQYADYQAILDDWTKTGNDLRSALKDAEADVAKQTKLNI